MEVGKLFIVLGLGLALIGLLLSLGFRGLPGDIVVQKKNFTFVLPIVSSIVLSLILTLVIYLLRR